MMSLHAVIAAVESAGLFIDADGEGEPTVWRPRPDRPSAPEALVRRCDVHEAIWTILSVVVPTAP